MTNYRHGNPIEGWVDIYLEMPEEQFRRAKEAVMSDPYAEVTKEAIRRAERFRDGKRLSD